MRDEMIYFLHIPKTAGATLIYTLDNYFHQSEILSPLLLSDLLKVPNLTQEINRYRFLRGHFDYAIRDLITQPVKIITMLRDPLERAISQFEHSRRHNDIAYWDTQNLITGSTKLDDFLNTPEAKEFLGNVQTRCFVPEWFGIPKINLWDVRSPEPDGDLVISLAKKRLEGCVFVGLQEHFEDSLRLLAFTLKLRRPAQVTNYNVAGGKRLKLTQLEEQTQKRLQELNNLDSQLYEHGRIIFETRFAEMRAYLDQHYPGKSLDEQIELDYRFYYRHHRQLFSPPVRYTFDQPLIGTNWHLRETQGDNYARWTGPENVATLEYPLYANRDVSVEIATTGAISMAALDSFKFEVNNTVVSLTRHMGDQGPVFTGVIPANSVRVAQPQVLKFSVEQTVIPADLTEDVGSDRRVGIRIRYIDFR